jgi:hypothetical protein
MRKVGFIARADNSGLGTMSWEFSKHIPCTKILVVKNGVYQIFPERFPGARVTKQSISKEDIAWLFEGIEVLVAFETTYDLTLFKQARKAGIKTIIIPMYECSPPMSILRPDVVICPSKLDFDTYAGTPETTVLQSPFPVNRQMIPFRKRKIAKVFVHNAGHGGLAERNGTSELLAAIPMVQSDVKFVIRSQRPIQYSHPKAEILVGNFEKYSDMWGEGDVFIFPHKFDGMSLPIQEALSSGMPVLSTRIYPFTKWMPNDWFFDAEEIIRMRVMGNSPEIEYAVVKPESIARKVDEIANKDISGMSGQADQLADKLSWENLKQFYVQILSK